VRLLDLATAGVIGAASILAILALNPHPYLASASRSSTQADLWDGLTTFIDEHGLYWLEDTSPQAVCSGVASASNSTVTYGASVGSTECGPPPPPGADVVYFDLQLPTREVVLSAWSGGQP
jgi:hypothetical protein